MPLMTYQERNDKAIAPCDPIAQIVFKHFQYRLSRVGESILITEGFRDKKKQAQEYAEGDSQVLWPYSFHNHGLAIDVVPVLFGQTWIIYNAPKRYEAIAKVAAQCGMDWGFQMWGFDKPHFQYTQRKPIKYFIDGGKLDSKQPVEQARSFYEGELVQLGRVRFASPSRQEKIDKEIHYVTGLLNDLPMSV